MGYLPPRPRSSPSKATAIAVKSAWIVGSVASRRQVAGDLRFTRPSRSAQQNVGHFLKILRHELETRKVGRTRQAESPKAIHAQLDFSSLGRRIRVHDQHSRIPNSGNSSANQAAIPANERADFPRCGCRVDTAATG